MSKTTPSPPHNPDDKLFKAVFKQPSHVREILESKAPKKLLAILDLDTLHISDTSFVDEKLAEFFADVVLDCMTYDGHPVIITLILEHKSYVPAFPNFQVMHYQDLTWAYQTGVPQPSPTPVVPVLFYHGTEKWEVRPWKSYLKGWDPAFKPFTPRGGYIFFDLSSMGDKKIKDFRSGFLKTAMLLMKHRLEREFLLENVLDIVNFVESETGIDEDARIENLRRTLRYLQGLKSLSWQEIRHKLHTLTKTNEVMSVMEEIKTEAFLEGIEKGMEKGMEKGGDQVARAIIFSLIQHLPEANDETIANLTSKPVSLVKQVRKDLINLSKAKVTPVRKKRNK